MRFNRPICLVIFAAAVAHGDTPTADLMTPRSWRGPGPGSVDMLFTGHEHLFEHWIER